MASKWIWQTGGYFSRENLLVIQFSCYTTLLCNLIRNWKHQMRKGKWNVNESINSQRSLCWYLAQKRAVFYSTPETVARERYVAKWHDTQARIWHRIYGTDFRSWFSASLSWKLVCLVIWWTTAVVCESSMYGHMLFCSLRSGIDVFENVS